MSTATEQHVSAEQLQTDAINTIRFLAVDAVEKAKSGHPGAPMGDAPIAYTLYTKHMRHNPKNPNWFNRDRFVLSNGHASMLLYSILYLTGYDLPLEQLQQFRQWGSRTAGHPERGLTPGVEVTTGPLGQGFGMGVGMGVAGKYLAATYNKPDHAIIDNFIYVLAGDGCMQEGISNESASIAGHLNLDNLIYLYDDNDISIEGNTDNTFTEDVGKRFEALNWHVQHVADVNNLAELDAAIETAKSVKGQPHLIVVKTHIGYGSPNRQDTGKIHGEALGPDEVKATKEHLGWPLEPTFYVPDEVLSYYRQTVERGAKLEQEWNEKYAAYKAAYPQEAQALEQALRNELPEGWDKDMPKWGADEKPSATRRASGKILNAIAPYLPNFIGGSGDLAGSTNTTLEKFGSFEPLEQYGGSYTGRTLHYGVREHAMGTIINGATAYGGVRIYGATFLSFLDYMREPVRLSALMELPSIFIFTHDSIGQGEDGPTHQPIEHLAMLRATPRLSTIRPADPNETAVAWKVALETTHQPTVLVFCRQDVPVLDQTKYTPASEGLPKGAYILSEAEGGSPQVILIATGSEVSLALEGQQALKDKGIAARVVSMPSWNLFEEQGEDYKQSVLPDSVPARLAIEAASSFGWQEYVGSQGAVLGLNRFGASAPGKVALEKFGFTVENVVRLSELLINDPKQARAEAKKIQDARFEWEGHNPNQSAAGNEGHS